MDSWPSMVGHGECIPYLSDTPLMATSPMFECPVELFVGA